jgi:hypothetical protein
VIVISSNSSTFISTRLLLLIPTKGPPSSFLFSMGLSDPIQPANPNSTLRRRMGFFRNAASGGPKSTPPKLNTDGGGPGDTSLDSIASSKSSPEIRVNDNEPYTYSPPEDEDSELEENEDRDYDPDDGKKRDREPPVGPDDASTSSPPAKAATKPSAPIRSSSEPARRPPPSAPPPRGRRSASSSSSVGGELPPQRAWYEFDLAVFVALVSPLGNWLTGGDHIKNLILLCFLLYYLHQLIEREYIPPFISPICLTLE